MQSMELSGMKTATEGAGACRHPAPRYARGRALILLLALGLTNAPALRAQKSRVATTALVLHVVPEEQMEVQSDATALKIRLASGSTAQIWAGSSCGAPAPQARIITKSGTYSIPLNTIGVTHSHTASDGVSICLLSSDGLLRDYVTVNQFELLASTSSVRSSSGGNRNELNE